MVFGIAYGMTKTLSIDRAGRVVIPQEIRKMFGFTAGSTLHVEITEMALVLTSAEARPAVACDDGVWVYDGAVPYDALLEAVASERDARDAAIWGQPL